MVLLKVVRPLKIYQQTQFEGLMSTGASFESTSEVRHFGIVKATRLKHKA